MDKSKDIFFMRRAIKLAYGGIGMVSPNPMVGAVIVGRGGEVLGEGFHKVYGGEHAEVMAVNSVRDRELLRGATIYVTLEPCSHYGKTPPCAELLVKCGFQRVVIGCKDPFVEVSGRGIKRLQEAGINVEVGVEEEGCWWMNRRFMTAQTKKRPYVILKWAQTKDGYLDVIRKAKVPAVWFTGKEAKKRVHRWRTMEDAIMVGRKTVEQDNPQLTAREWKGKNPLRVVVTSKEISKEYRVMDSEAETIMITGGVDKILAELQQRKVQSVIIEGGAKLLGSFIESGKWDEIRRFTAQEPLAHYYPQLPKITGIPAPTPSILSTKKASHQHLQELADLFDIEEGLEFDGLELFYNRT